jgi:hypothetical protein
MAKEDVEDMSILVCRQFDEAVPGHCPSGRRAGRTPDPAAEKLVCSQGVSFKECSA